MNSRTQANNPEFLSSWLVHFENKEIVKTFWLQVTNSWNSWFFFTFRELVSCSIQTQHPFFWKYRELWHLALMQHWNTSGASFSYYRVFVSSCVHMLQTQPPDFWHELVTSSVCVLQTQPPVFWYKFLTSCVANTTTRFLARVRDFVSSCVANTTARFLTRVRDLVSSGVANTIVLVSITNLMNACCCCCCWFSFSYLADFLENMNISSISTFYRPSKSVSISCYFQSRLQ